MNQPEYFDTEPRRVGADKYHGAVAKNYDAKRLSQQKWHDEQRIIEGWIKEMPGGSSVLDCPCGTGRFLPVCEANGLFYDGIDRSEDMLTESAKKRSQAIDNWRQYTRMGWLSLGDATNLEREDTSVDTCLMIRLSRWLTDEQRVQALQEMQRVARKRIIFTARVRDHPKQWTYEEIKAALSGWKITRDEMAGDENYRVIMLEPE